MAGAGSLFLNGIPVNAMNKRQALSNLAAASNNDRVLVLIQLHGGNDGLNTLIPLNHYDDYHNLRSNIALPEQKILTLDSTLPGDQQLALHPDMVPFKRLYDNGRTSIVQSVAYDNVNGSHFRSRDVWFMGGDHSDHLDSGWAGRYLDTLYPQYPDEYPSSAMPDPLALEMGSRVSLAFHREDGVPMALATDDPEKFYQLVSQVGGKSPETSTASYYDDEINYILNVESKSNDYAERLNQVFARGKNSNVTYPDKYPHYLPSGKGENELSAQLKTIARLLSGGSKTKIFLARIDGFDTHAHQVQDGDPTRGSHAALLYNLFHAVEAFQNDLKNLGLEDKVLTVTFSEFGRRAKSNASLGTDHGKAAPMFVFGKHVNPGVVGKNADLNDLDEGNIKHQYDYRQVLGTLLKDWMQADTRALQNTQFSGFVQTTLPIIYGQSPANAPAAPVAPPPPENNVDERYFVEKIMPNPARTYLDVIYHLENHCPLSIRLMDLSGNVIVMQEWESRGKGKHKTRFMLPALKSGMYVLVWQTPENKVSQQVRIEQ